MMDRKLLESIARLANLSLDEKDEAEYVGKLEAIFQYVAQLEKVDVAQVEPMSHVLGATNVVRDDIVEPSLSVEEGLKNAPDTSGQYIRGPLIIDPGTEHS